MFIISWLITFALWLPVLGLTLIAYRRHNKWLFLRGAWGAALFLWSFVSFWPWLDLNPLKFAGVDEAYGVSVWVVGLLGKGWWGALAAKLAGFDVVLNPRGWLAFALVQHPVRWLVLPMGSVAVMMAWLVELPLPSKRLVGQILAVVTAVLLALLYYHLPTIDSLGEPSLPHPLAYARPVLGVHLIWWGPLVMMAGLILMLVAGIEAAQEETEVVESFTDFNW